ncbi:MULTISPECIES: DUF6268 family outer membrane beta-barrel protein [Capnocytophaga]|uniref:DUF6268 domain-containing protein n=3 Tax=Bacteroidota TaxID=976 RepID=A0A2T5XUB4_9FLAO|nr:MULTISPECIES: DUF6268 family outer membrane beta-barrel protein [Capnocytophaga]PTX06869.1 hypothetical protein C8P65_10646 [Capnocytophaga leadbetteri]QGS17320.1 hypothetical protein FOC45_03215 [Capnocytophaga sp. FDAARGOS_737]
MKEIFTFIILLLGVNSFAQISVKTEYIGNSEFYDAVADTNTGNGSAMIYSAGAMVPLSMQASAEDDPYKRATIWGVALSGTFVKMDNHNFPIGKELPSQVMNLGATVLHLRPLKERWSMLMALGIGSYTPENRLSAIRIDENVLANGALVFIWHWRPNLEIGGGVALNNSFGYPMVFPALYLKYKGGFSDKFTIDINLLDGTKVAFGYDYSENLSLKLVANIGGYSAYLRRNGQKEMFSSQTFFVGLEPEFKLGKHISIPVTFGGSFIRSGRYRERTLSAMFASEAKNEDGSARSSVFLPALYFAAGITIK